MFKIKINNLCFSFIMAIFMVYRVALYNIFLGKHFNYDSLYIIITRMFPEFVIAYIILNFFAFPVTKKLVYFIKINKNIKVFEILFMTFFIVFLTAPIMSLFVIILHGGLSIDVFSIWLSRLVMNIPFALCLQVFGGSPLARFIFSKIYFVSRIFKNSPAIVILSYYLNFASRFRII